VGVAVEVRDFLGKPRADASHALRRDEGVLASLTGHATPDPLAFFNRRCRSRSQQA
jgi:hypothetical protein